MSIERGLFTSTIYIIDMSSIKMLHDRYPQALFPTIWELIFNLIANNQFFSHVEVYREIKQTSNPKDKLLVWSNKQKKIFLDIDDCQILKIDLIKAKYDSNYWNNKMNKLAPWADPNLIAVAMCESAIIITEENKTKLNNIPPIAVQFGIKSVNLLEFFQELKIRL
jgi:hypothetical protein